MNRIPCCNLQTGILPDAQYIRPIGSIPHSLPDEFFRVPGEFVQSEAYYSAFRIIIRERKCMQTIETIHKGRVFGEATHSV